MDMGRRVPVGRQLARAPRPPRPLPSRPGAQVRVPHEMDARAVEAAGVPLPASVVERLEADLDGEELVWGPSYVRVRGTEYSLLRLLYVPYSVAA